MRVLAALGFALIALAAGTQYPRLRAGWSAVQADMNRPHYEIGPHKGAKYCAECHEGLYEQWLHNSRHAVATSATSFHNLRAKFARNALFRVAVSDSACHACHGSKAINQGVDCETCHGTVLPETSIEETHERKYSLDRDRLKSPKFCAACHELKNPMSGDYIMALYEEWRSSPAASRGATCQTCHMPSIDGQPAYHGFDSAVRKPDIYLDDLKIYGLRFDPPHIKLTIENRVDGHAIPAGGPTRVLVLSITFTDEDDNIVHRVTETFGKKFALTPLAGLMPFKLVENSQLQSGEARHLEYLLPDDLQGRAQEAHFALEWYEISDEHGSDIQKAHWISEPFLESRASLGVEAAGPTDASAWE